MVVSVFKSLNTIFTLLIFAGLIGCSDVESPSVAFPYGSVTEINSIRPNAEMPLSDAQFTVIRAGEMQIPLIALVDSSYQYDSPLMKCFWEMCERCRLNQVILIRTVPPRLSPTKETSPMHITNDVDDILEQDFPCECQFKSYKLNRLTRGAVLKYLRPHSFNNIFNLTVIAPFTAPCEYDLINIKEAKWEQCCIKNRLYCQLRFADSEEVQMIVSQKGFSKESLLTLVQIERFMEALVDILKREKWEEEIIIRESWTLKERYYVSRYGIECAE